MNFTTYCEQHQHSCMNVRQIVLAYMLLAIRKITIMNAPVCLLGTVYLKRKILDSVCCILCKICNFQIQHVKEVNLIRTMMS